MDYSLISLCCLLFACLLTGFSKSSIGGMGILTIPVIVYGFGAKEALGIFLPILIFTDIWTVWLYRGLCNWKVLFYLFPTTLIGIVSGYFLIDIIPDSWFVLVIGIIIISMLVLSFFTERFPSLGSNRSYSGVLGTLVGLTSMVANSAGTLVGMYFLQHKMEKREFIATRNHFFVFMNSIKLPFIANLGLISSETLMLDAMFIPAIFIGSWLGLKLVDRINLQFVKKSVQIAALISGIRMIWVGIEDLIG